MATESAKNEIHLCRINTVNYPLFANLVAWRLNGEEASSTEACIPSDVPAAVRSAIARPDYWLFTAVCQARMIGWISLYYLPKVGKYNGHGHLYVDELWVAPAFRQHGAAKLLMKQAETCALSCGAVGIRLYVNTENPEAQALYAALGYEGSSTAFFKEKHL